MKVLYTADGTINNAMGARRGGRGALAQAQKRGRDGSPCYGVALEPGEFVVSHFGSRRRIWPGLRARPGPRSARSARGLGITAVRARSMYGVVTTGDAADDTLAVDAAATQSLGLRCVRPLQGLI
jgi:N-methylhydantoinase B